MNSENEKLEVTEEIESTGEDNVEEVELEDIEASQSDKLKTIKAKLADCEKAKASHLEALQSAKAEFLNSKKRLEKDTGLVKERTINSMIGELLPLCDSFDMAMSNQEAWQATDATWRQGVEAIKAQLDSLLKKYQVNQIAKIGDQFDPNLHEALSTIDSDDGSEKIVQILQPGYERNGEIIRVAKVVISN